MRITPALAALALLAGFAVGTANPAEAQDQPLQGVFAYQEPGSPPSTWQIVPVCSPTMGDLREPLFLPVGCTLKVTSSTSRQVTNAERAANFGADARLVTNRWFAQVTKIDGLVCPDGSTAQTVDTYEFDSGLAGTHTRTHGAECGLEAGLDRTPFTLTFLKELPYPVDRYPFYCQPGGLRSCA